jgi:hypothetical protein
MSTRALAFAVMLSQLGCAVFAKPAAWGVRPDKDQQDAFNAAQVIDEKDIYEVVPTKVGAAREWHLDAVAFAPIDCKTADYLAGNHFQCPTSRKKPYLVRAVFAGTGALFVRYSGQTLFVFHGALGSGRRAKKHPLNHQPAVRTEGGPFLERWRHVGRGVWRGQHHFAERKTVGGIGHPLSEQLQRRPPWRVRSGRSAGHLRHPGPTPTPRTTIARRWRPVCSPPSTAVPLSN